jgi:cold-inducible RNA-binding protein
VANARTGQAEAVDRVQASGSRRLPAVQASLVGMNDRLNRSVMLTLQTSSSLQALQRLVGNRGVTEMIADRQTQPSAGLYVQREDEPAEPVVRRGGNRLYVGNLSFNTSRESLEETFAGAGQVREVAMPTDRETGQPRGFAFVTMGTTQEATLAISQLNGLMLNGRSLKVNDAQERASRGSGSEGGGGGRDGEGGGGRGRY